MITTEILSTRPSSVLTVKFSSIWRASSTRPRSRPLASASVTASFRAGAPDGLSANVVEALFTHFIREEDKTVRSGKLDEELARVSNIADEIVPRSMVLSNESFATTNEREGSEIGRQVVEALLGSAVKVLFVTHQFTLANTFYQKGDSTSLFLRASARLRGAGRLNWCKASPCLLVLARIFTAVSVTGRANALTAAESTFTPQGNAARWAPDDG